MTATPAPDAPIRPFADWLREQGEGRTHAELSEGLRDLVAKVIGTGKKGVLTFTVTVETLPKSDGRALTVSDEIRIKFPEFSRPTSLFFPDQDHNLRRTDPRQLAFESLREVPPVPLADAEIRVNPATGEIVG